MENKINKNKLIDKQNNSKLVKNLQQLYQLNIKAGNLIEARHCLEAIFTILESEK